MGGLGRLIAPTTAWVGNSFSLRGSQFLDNILSLRGLCSSVYEKGNTSRFQMEIHPEINADSGLSDRLPEGHILPFGRNQLTQGARLAERQLTVGAKSSIAWEGTRETAPVI